MTSGSAMSRVLRFMGMPWEAASGGASRWSGERALRESATADGVDDLDLVAVGERAAAVLAARHDLAVQLHRHAPAAIAGGFQQLGDGGGGSAIARLAIERDLHAPIVAAGAVGAESWHRRRAAALGGRRGAGAGPQCC